MNYARIILLSVLMSSSCWAYSARYGRRIYTPENYPSAITCRNCGMCSSLRSQWEAQGWQDPYKRKAVKPRRTVAATSPKKLASTKQWPGVFYVNGEKRTHKEGYEFAWRATKTTQRQRMCFGPGDCRYVDIEVEGPSKWVQLRRLKENPAHPVESDEIKRMKQELQEMLLAAKEAKDSPDSDMGIPISQAIELKSTPHDAVEAILDFLPTNAGLFVDLGCGDGRVVEAAAKRGYVAVGVELDEQRAKETQERLADVAFIRQGDVRDTKLDRADVVYMWLYEDLMAQIKIPNTATVVSYSHPYPGATKVELGKAKHAFYVRFGKRKP